LTSLLNHENIVEFIGVVITSTNKVWLVTELMDGDLKSVLKIATNTSKVHIAKQIALAL
jgi:serine/threonine protein kinase